MSDSTVEKQIIDNNEEWLDMTLDRMATGLLVKVKTVPKIEEYMKSLGNGTVDDAIIYDRYWSTVNPTDPPLKVYKLGAELIGADRFRLGLVGKELHNPQTDMINLSFLRIVGISQGISFVVKTPMSRPAMKILGKELIQASNSLLQDYIAPFRLSFRILSR